MAFSKLFVVFVIFLGGEITISSAGFQASRWSLAHATFYGGDSGFDTLNGACGYGNLFDGYGTDTAALSSVLFRDGYSCGQCYQIRCTGSTACYGGSPVVTVTATNLCPPNWALDSNNGGWCNPPRTHFDMSKPAFSKIAQMRAGIVPVMYRRVPCTRYGGMRFALQGNMYWVLVYVLNVGGAGDVSNMSVKGGKTNWIRMSHNWGVSFQAFALLGGQTLSFKITSYTTKQTIVAWNVAPTYWSLGFVIYIYGIYLEKLFCNASTI